MVAGVDGRGPEILSVTLNSTSLLSSESSMSFFGNIPTVYPTQVIATSYGGPMGGGGGLGITLSVSSGDSLILRTSVAGSFSTGITMTDHIPISSVSSAIPCQGKRSRGGGATEGDGLLELEGDCSIYEQSLKNREKSLTLKEKRLKDMEKKISNRKISVGDKLDQNEFSKAYVVSMENR